jgi:O-antigen/teichoic acid export membrane protein
LRVLTQSKVLKVNQDRKTSYQQIFKATSLFGGVQMVNILISIFKSKAIAIFLGPNGMGIVGLFTSAISLFGGITSMGLATVAVKNVAEANGSDDEDRISKVVSVFRKLVWVSGLLGMFSVIIFSPYLSFSTFGNYDYIISFILLSITLLIQQISAGQSVVLQGMRRIKDLAKSVVFGSFGGLLISVPIYSIMGVRGIVYSLVLASITNLIITWYFSNRIKIKKTSISLKESLLEGKSMLKMGMVMSLNSILVAGEVYLLRIIIVRIGGIEDVGFYTSGLAIVTGYTGLVFTAMGTDYYPRLAAVNKDNEKCNQIIIHQAEIATLILTPILILFLLFAPFAVILLYSKSFLPITGYMQWAIVGMLFKALSWAISYQFLAKHDMKMVAINETFAHVSTLIFSTIGYYFWGLDGLGIAFSLSYFLYCLLVFFIAHNRYELSFPREFKKLYFIELTFVITCFVLVYFWENKWVYLPTVILALLCFFYSYKEIDKRLEIRSIIKKIYSRI